MAEDRCARCRRKLHKPQYFMGRKYGVKCIVRVKKEAQKTLIGVVG